MRGDDAETTRRSLLAGVGAVADEVSLQYTHGPGDSPPLMRVFTYETEDRP
jgi:hypothetical protein